MGALLGVVCGLATAAPLVHLLRKGQASNRRLGIAAVAAAFLLEQGAMLAVRTWRREELLPFGVMSVATFLLAVVVAAVFREMNQ